MPQKPLNERADELADILQKEGCCFSPGNADYAFHKPDGVCRCYQVQALLMIRNTPGAALKLLEEKEVDSSV